MRQYYSESKNLYCRHWAYELKFSMRTRLQHRSLDKDLEKKKKKKQK